MIGIGNMKVASILGLFSGGIGWPEIVIILALLLLLFGGRKLPELARGLGKGLRGFKEELHGVKKEIEEEPPDADKQIERKEPAAGGEKDSADSSDAGDAKPPES